jgi:hypothetical protein
MDFFGDIDFEFFNEILEEVRVELKDMRVENVDRVHLAVLRVVVV